MSTLADIREGLRVNLSSIPGANVSAYVRSNPQLPQIWVLPHTDEPAEYHRAMHDGGDEWPMLVQAFVGTVSDEVAQRNLDEFLASSGDRSVKAAIESDKTLGGAAEDVVVQRCSGYREYARPDGSTALGAEWTVLVMTDGA